MRSSSGIAAWPLLAALLLSACQPGDSAADNDDEEDAAIPVEIATPSRGTVQAMYTGTAPIEAFADATVIAKVGGEVREILVEEGDDVQRGQVLARLDGDRLRLEKEQAEAQLRKLRGDYQRNIDLKDKGLISEGDFEKIRFELEALQAKFDLASLELDYTEIRAPIDGVISERYIKLGNTIEVNAQTFKVTSLEPLVSYLHVPEREYRRIETGQPATVEIDALAGTHFEATVARISPVVDPATGTFKITIEVTDDERRLKPGMFGRIRIVYDSRANAMLIPRGAVIEESGESFVYVVTDGKADKRVVRTGYADGGNIEIVEGVAERDEVVVVGQTSLKNGSSVSIINRSTDEDMAAHNGADAN